MLSRSVEDFHATGGETMEHRQKRARLQDRSVPLSVVEREIIFMLSSSNRINNTLSPDPAVVAQEVGQFFHRRPNMALLVTEEACQIELMSANFFNYVPPIPSSFFLRMECVPIAFAEREGGFENPTDPSTVLTPQFDSYYPIGSISGFYNFPPLKLSQVPAHFKFDIRECSLDAYFPVTAPVAQSLDLEVVLTFKLERLGDAP